MAARRPARVRPVDAAIARLMALVGKGPPPARIAREVEIIVGEWLAAPDADPSLTREWLEELREQILTGVVDAEEQVSYVDASEPAIVKQANMTLAALVASRDAIVRAAAKI